MPESTSMWPVRRNGRTVLVSRAAVDDMPTWELAVRRSTTRNDDAVPAVVVADLLDADVKTARVRGDHTAPGREEYWPKTPSGQPVPAKKLTAYERSVIAANGDESRVYQPPKGGKPVVFKNKKALAKWKQAKGIQ